MKVLGFIKCLILGHTPEGESITTNKNPNHWLKKCSRCGMYIMHAEIGQAVISEKEALKIKKEWEKKLKLLDEAFEHFRKECEISEEVGGEDNGRKENTTTEG